MVGSLAVPFGPNEGLADWTGDKGRSVRVPPTSGTSSSSLNHKYKSYPCVQPACHQGYQGSFLNPHGVTYVSLNPSQTMD